MDYGTSRDIKLIQDWLCVTTPPKKAELIFVFGGNTINLAKKALDLFKLEYSKKILLTGGNNSGTLMGWDLPIANVLKKYLLEKEVSEDSIITQTNSSTLEEDIAMSIEYLNEFQNGSNIILIAKPTEQRRAYATILKLLPHFNYINCPCDTDLSVDTEEYLIKKCIDEIEKLKELGELGEIMNFHLPHEIEEAYSRLTTN